MTKLQKYMHQKLENNKRKMNARIIAFVLSLLPLLPVMAQRNGDIRKYQQQKQKEFQSYRETKQKEFDEFRCKKNEEFAKFMEKGPWEFYNKKEPIKRPIEKELRPVIYNEKDKRKEYERLFSEVVPIEQTPMPQPTPIRPIRQNDDGQSYNSFTYYGTQMKARWGDIATFKLSEITEKSLANGFRKLTDTKYNNLLRDCLSLRDEYSLCDWAYYQMLDSLASAACGKGSNESIFLQGILFQQSGYTIRFAMEEGAPQLHLLIKLDGYAYDTPPFVIDGETFFLFGKSKDRLQICKMAYPEERSMSLAINAFPRFEFNSSDVKTIKSQQYNFNIESVVNTNLVHFMNDYPTAYDGKDFMTRWAYYANTPVSEKVRQFVYPQLREQLKNTNKLLAANMLLNWVQPPYDDEQKSVNGVQMGFPYLFDDVVWGHDRAFFAEETFYYPGSDCEDHAILFSHLVRDLLGLDVVLVYYPNHLSTAICFNEDVEGDYIMVGNRRFVVADPTYTGAPVGVTMPQCAGQKAKVILCKR